MREFYNGESSQHKTKEEFNKLRAAFMRRASAPELSASALKLAYVIAFKLIDTRDQTLVVGQDRLAKETGCTSRTIRNLLALLEPLGLEIDPGHGPKSASTYRIVEPTLGAAEKRKPVSGFKRKPVSGIATKTGNLEHENRKFGAPESGNTFPPLLTKSLQEESPSKRSKTLAPDPEKPEQASERRTSETPFSDPEELAPAALTPTEPKPEQANLFEAEKPQPTTRPMNGHRQEAKKGRGHPRKKASKASQPSQEQLEELFERFWAVYPKRDGTNPRKPAADKFQALVVKRKISPEAIINGARRYATSVEELEGTERRYIMQAITWLNKEGWNDQYRKRESHSWLNDSPELRRIHDELFGESPTSDLPDPNLADLDLTPDEWTRH